MLPKADKKGLSNRKLSVNAKEMNKPESLHEENPLTRKQQTLVH
jgi:hypothetical protein